MLYMTSYHDFKITPKHNMDNKINRFVMVFAFAPTPLTDW